jgi:ribosomal-protein-alanine N-acetyltransferase
MNNTPDTAGKWLMETDRLRLRAVTVDDTALMLAIWNDPAFIENVADRGIRTVEQAREAINTGIQTLFEKHGYGPYCLSLKSDGAMIGICGIFKRENLADPDIGFAVLPDYCGIGYAGEAAMAVVDYARDKLSIDVLTAIVSPTNAPSIGLIEKLGLTFERMITMPGDDDAICLYGITLAGQSNDPCA